MNNISLWSEAKTAKIINLPPPTSAQFTNTILFRISFTPLKEKKIQTETYGMRVKSLARL